MGEGKVLLNGEKAFQWAQQRAHIVRQCAVLVGLSTTRSTDRVGAEPTGLEISKSRLGSVQVMFPRIPGAHS